MQFTLQERMSLFLAALTGFGRATETLVYRRTMRLGGGHIQTQSNSSSSVPPVIGNDPFKEFTDWQEQWRRQRVMNKGMMPPVGPLILAASPEEETYSGALWSNGDPPEDTD